MFDGLHYPENKKYLKKCDDDVWINIWCYVQDIFLEAIIGIIWDAFVDANWDANWDINWDAN